MIKKQKIGDFIKYFKSPAVLLLVFVFAALIFWGGLEVFAESNNAGGNSDNAGNAGNTSETIPICHATASQKNPYVFLEVDANSVNGEGANNHSSHTDDIIPITDLNGDGDIDIIDIKDCNFAVVKPAPIVNDDSYSVEENSVLNISAPGLLTNDENVSEPDITATKLSNANHGSLMAHDDGSFVYTPEENYHGADSFSYRVCVNDLCDDPWGHSTPTGYVYKTTKQKINELYCKYIKGI